MGCWNITSWTNRQQDVISEMEEHKIDICAFARIREKRHGKYQVPKLYSYLTESAIEAEKSIKMGIETKSHGTQKR